jgi:hypothetical protein
MPAPSRRYPGSPTTTRQARSSRESVSTKVIAAGLGVVLGAGGLALSQKLWPHDPNEITACENAWIIQSIGTDNHVLDMPSAMAALEMGRSELVARIQEARGTDFSIIAKEHIPSPYQSAAKLLIGNESGFTNYDTSESRLDTPREEFCEDPQEFGIYKTPDYVRAEAALKAVGIDINPEAAVQ